MMPAVSGAVLAISDSLAASIVVKVTVVVALGLATVQLSRRSRAAVRHALLAVTFGAMLLLPIVSMIAPSVHVTVPVAEVSRAAWPLAVNNTAPIPPVTLPADGGVALAAPQKSSTFSLSVLLLAGWIVGAAVFLVPVITGLWQIRSLRRSGLPWLDGQSVAETLALDAGIHRRIEVLLHEALPGPITCGVLHPAVVLPRDAESWPREDLSRAIVHELEHVRRGDSATRFLARAVCALYWFHPLTWIAWRKLVLEAERSCDDAVLRRSEATAYADQLVGLAKRLPTAQRSPLLAMASRSDLAARIAAVLDGKQQRGQVGGSSLALASAAAVLLVFVVSPLILVAAPQAPAAAASIEQTEQQVIHFRPSLAQSALQNDGRPSIQLAQAKAPTVQPRPVAPRNPQTFDVVSIKPVDPNGGRGAGVPPPCGPLKYATGLVYGLTTASKLIQDAYGLSPHQISGGPSWLDSDSYCIEAKSLKPAGADQLKLMLQPMLADRFKLVARYGTKEMPVYMMTVAKKGLLFEVKPGDPMATPNLRLTTQDLDAAGYKLRTQIDQSSPARMLVTQRTMAEFAAFLSSSPLAPSDAIDRPVVDKTGLEGRYLLVMRWTDDDFRGDIEQQFGLKLEPGKAPLPAIVIEGVSKPSAN